MNSELTIAIALLITGVLVILTILIRWGLEKSAIPSLAGYLLLGFLLRWFTLSVDLLNENVMSYLEFLGDIGIVVLLFRVGMESDLKGLIGQLQNATPIWVGNVMLSAILGYLASFYLLNYSLTTSLYIAVALTATSVAVPVAVWRGAGALDSSDGKLLLDAAELDDISAIILMSLLFAVVPVLHTDSNGVLLSTVLSTGGILLGKLVLLGCFCYAFARFLKPRLTKSLKRIAPIPDPLLMLVAIGFIISGLAGMIGFSIALGAFFAGLVFSHDPKVSALDRPLNILHDLFTPFFFIVTGLKIDPQTVLSAIYPGTVLLIAAIAGKFLGTLGPALFRVGWRSSILLGVSMIPRAEIAMIVMRHGQETNHDTVPQEIFSAMVLVTAVTCIVPPLILNPMLLHQKRKD
ncbi:MAG: cation:proton antiporter [Planctomycetaceae bacterium]